MVKTQQHVSGTISIDMIYYVDGYGSRELSVCTRRSAYGKFVYWDQLTEINLIKLQSSFTFNHASISILASTLSH